MALNIADAFSALVQALYQDHESAHGYIEHPYEFGRDNLPLGLGIMGQYKNATWNNLTEGEFAFPRLTIDGKLVTDASITIGALTVNVTPIVWLHRYYLELTVNDTDTACNFLFAAKQVIIANDDANNAVYINYGAAAVADATHDKIAAQETFEDQVISPNVHLICAAGKTASVRVWARTDV